MKTKFSISEAKNKLTAIIHDIENLKSAQPVELTRHGKPVVILMSVDDYKKMTKKNRGLWNEWLAFRGKFESEAFDFDDSVFEGLRDYSKGRDVDV